MQRRNREMSIFSMSALDLFASALGAFILIAIVIFPYFPNTGRAASAPVRQADANPDSMEALEAVRERLVQLEGELAASQAQLDDADARPDELAAVRDRLADAESELAASRNRLAEATADAREEARAQSRLAAELQSHLDDSQARERGLEQALDDERRRKFLLVTVSWDRDDDVDLHVVDPHGNEYYYAARRHPGSPAQFEEDTTDGPGNEVWLHPRVEPGEYAVYYNLYSKRSRVVGVRGAAVHSDGREELPAAELSVEGARRRVATVVVSSQGRVSLR